MSAPEVASLRRLVASDRAKVWQVYLRKALATHACMLKLPSLATFPESSPQKRMKSSDSMPASSITSRSRASNSCPISASWTSLK